VIIGPLSLAEKCPITFGKRQLIRRLFLFIVFGADLECDIHNEVTMKG